MCLVGEIKSLSAVVNRIFAAEIRTVAGTWLFPSGFGHSRVPRRAPISAKRRLNSKAITISGPTFSRNRRTSEILSKIRKNAIFPEKRDFSGKTPFFRKNAIFPEKRDFWSFFRKRPLLHGNLAICRSPVAILTVVLGQNVKIQSRHIADPQNPQPVEFRTSPILLLKYETIRKQL